MYFNSVEIHIMFMGRKGENDKYKTTRILECLISRIKSLLLTRISNFTQSNNVKSTVLLRAIINTGVKQGGHNY